METMETYLNKEIKEIIKQFPPVGEILDGYNIGCVPCNVGTCLFKDIVEVHNLSLEDEHDLMVKIAGVIYPGQDVEIPRIGRKVGPMAGEIKYSPPMKKLVGEHVYIKKLLSLVPVITESLDLTQEADRRLITDCIDFIRSYADKYHHAKEEDILFKKFGEGLDIIKAMLEEHELGRSHVRAALNAVSAGDKATIKENLSAFAELLFAHIKKEDEILYPWMDRSLSMAQVGELFAEFSNVDDRFKDAAQKYEGFINSLEEKYQKEEVKANV